MYKPYKQKPGNCPGKKPYAKKVAAQQHPELHLYFLKELAEVADGESQLLAAWPALAKVTASLPLKEFCNQCMAASSKNVKRFQQVSPLSFIGETALCIAVEDILATTKNFASGLYTDDKVVEVMKKLLHYLAASYDGLAILASRVQQDGFACLLDAAYARVQLLDDELSNISCTISPGELIA